MDPFTTRFDFMDSCPWCRHPIDAASDIENQARPREGDVAVCIVCGKPAVYTISMRLRRPEPGELEAGGENYQKVLKYSAMVQGLHQRVDAAAARAELPRVRYQSPRRRRRRHI